MKFQLPIKIIAICAIAAGVTPVFSHIVLEEKSAPAGTIYKAVFQVGHGCQGSPTTGVSVQIPAGFQGARPYPKAGWTLSTQLGKLAKPYEQYGKQVTEDLTVVSWTAASKESALQDAYFDEFQLRGKLPETAGPMWFKVVQTCENGSNSWSEVPVSGMSTKGLKAPAPLLQVVAVAQPSAAAAPVLAAVTAPSQAVQVKDAWARATVAGQKASGAFMKITAKTATRLVAVSTPVAGVAEVHEMKMDGDIMKMRAIPGLDLPAGKTVELRAGGYHLMLMDLKQALVSGSVLPLTLHFKDAKGVESKQELLVPVAMLAPASVMPSGAAPAKLVDKAGEQEMHMHNH